MQNFYFKQLLTALLLLCATVATAHDFVVGGIYYNITSTTDFTVEVTYGGNDYDSYSNEYSGNVVIPESVTYNGSTYSVTSIGDTAFRDCSGLTNVVIPNSVTSIGYAAFTYCSGLTGVVIPNGVTSIGSFAFYDCSGLTNVVIPNSVTSIGDYAFRGCSGLTSVEIPNSVTSIGEWAFAFCYGLTSIEIPNSVTSIGGSAFRACSGLTNVKITNSVTSIGDYAFYDCGGLKEVHISDLSAWCGIDFGGCYANPLYYAENLYLNDDLLTELTIPNSVTEVKNFAFYNCSGLTNVVIPDGVTEIKGYAFSGCSGLKSVVIPNSVTSIGSDAFYGCSGLKKVINCSSLKFLKGSTANGYVAYNADTVINAPNGPVEGDFVFAVIDGVNTLCAYIGAGGDVTLPADYNGENYVIGSYAFSYCSGLTSVEIPNSVTSIGSSAFYDCSGLKKVINFSSLKFSKGSTANGYVAYYAETVINAPNGPVEGDFVFAVIDGVNTLCAYIGAGGDVTLPADYNGENYVIGADVFKNNTSLTSVVIPNSVTSIGDNAFDGCSGLKKVINCSSLTFSKGSTANGYVAYYAETVINAPTGSVEGDFVFAVIDGVNTLCLYVGAGGDVTLPADYKGENYVIGADVFKNNTSLTSVVIPNSVTSIGGSAFYNCSGLKKVINCSSLKFSKGSTANGYVACYAETVINVPNGSVEGDFVFAVIDGVNTLCFYIGAGGDVSLPVGYKGENYVIGADVFKNNTSLTSVVIPAAVTSIGTDVFSNCRGLKEVHISDLSAWCGIDFSGLNANPLYYAHNLYLNGELVTDIVIPDGVTEIKRYAFEGCSGLTSVVIPNSVTSIGMCAFDGCTGLTSVVVGNSVTSIGEWAFYNCRSLTSVVIPASVTSIGDYAFRDCRRLTGIISMIPAEDLFSVTNYTFDYNCVLYVPKGAKETYASTGGWSKFKNIVETDFTGVDEVKGENGKIKDVYYDLNGRAVERPANGLYIKNGKKVFVK